MSAALVAILTLLVMPIDTPADPVSPVTIDPLSNEQPVVARDEIVFDEIARKAGVERKPREAGSESSPFVPGREIRRLPCMGGPNYWDRWDARHALEKLRSLQESETPK